MQTNPIRFDVDDSSEVPSDHGGQWARKISAFQRRFSGITDFYGMSHVIRSFSLRGQIFWFVLLLVCLCLAANDVYQTVQAHDREDTVTKIEAAENETITFPKVTLCTTLLPSEFNWSGDFPFSDASSTREFLNQNEQLIQDLGLLNEKQVPPKFASTGNEIDIKRIVFLSISTVLSVTKLENRNWFSDVPTNFTTFGIVNRDNFYPNASTVEAIVETYKFYAERNMSVDRLLKPSVQWLCHLLNITVDQLTPADAGGRRKSTPFSICDKEVLWLAPLPLLGLQSAMCLRVPRDVFSFAVGLYRSVHIGYSPQPVYHKSPLVDDRVLIFVDLEGHQVCTPFSRSCRGTTWDYSAFELQIESHYNFKSLNRAPCRKREKSVCMASCRARFIFEKCNCWPVSFNWPIYGRERPAGAEFCGTERNLSRLGTGVPHLSDPTCANNISRQWFNDGCDRSCFHRCYFTAVSWTKVDYPKVFVKDPTHRNVIYRVREFTYPKISEDLDMDGREFLGQLGGSFVLWIGLWTFLALIGIMFYPVFTYACRSGGARKRVRHLKEDAAKADGAAELSVRVEALARERENDREEIRKLNLIVERLAKLNQGV